MFQLREFQILSSDSKGNTWKLGRRIAAEIFGILGDSLKRNLFMPLGFFTFSLILFVIQVLFLSVPFSIMF